MDNYLQKLASNSPTVAYLGTLTVGFTAGIGAMLGLQNYSGITMITKNEYVETSTKLLRAGRAQTGGGQAHR